MYMEVGMIGHNLLEFKKEIVWFVDFSGKHLGITRSEMAPTC